MDKTGEMSDRPGARLAILAAFRDIILEAGYEEVRVLDVVKRSGVARSTFYEYFSSREDLLRDSLRGVLTLLTPTVAPSCDVAVVARMLDHLAQNRAMVKSLMADPGTDALVDVYAEVLEEAAPLGGSIARAVAGAHLALLSPWLDGRDRRTASDLARAMRAIGLALSGTV